VGSVQCTRCGDPDQRANFRAHDHVQHMERQEAARANTCALCSEGPCRMMLIEQKSSECVSDVFAYVLQR
jgi:hypothetical protein